MSEAHIKTFKNVIFSSHLKDDNIPIEWHWLWDQIQKWYGDIQKRETETEFVNRVRPSIPPSLLSELEQLRKENDRLKEEGKQSLLLYNSMTKNIELLQGEKEKQKEDFREKLKANADMHMKDFSAALNEINEYRDSLEKILVNRWNIHLVEMFAKQALKK